MPLLNRPLPRSPQRPGCAQRWQALERRDIDRAREIVNVQRTVSGGEVVELGKTQRSRRQVPLTARARDALDAIPPRLDTPLVFPAARGVLNLDNWRRRVWAPAVEASGVRRLGEEAGRLIPVTGIAMRVWLALLLVAVVAGCGGDSADEAGPAPGGPPGETERDAGPSPSINKAAYRDSKDLCSAFSVEEVAEEYGGDPSDPISVADAYANEAYRARCSAAARDGCLAGLRGP